MSTCKEWLVSRSPQTSTASRSKTNPQPWTRRTCKQPINSRHTTVTSHQTGRPTKALSRSSGLARSQAWTKSGAVFKWIVGWSRTHRFSGSWGGTSRRACRVLWLKGRYRRSCTQHKTIRSSATKRKSQTSIEKRRTSPPWTKTNGCKAQTK